MHAYQIFIGIGNQDVIGIGIHCYVLVLNHNYTGAQTNFTASYIYISVPLSLTP